MKLEFQRHIHIFRSMAIILIIGAHVYPSLDWSANVLIGRMLDGFSKEASALFIFISGYLFQHLSGKFNYSVYLRRKIKYVISPYLILSIPSIVLFTVFLQREGMWSWFYDIPIWSQALLFVLTGKHLAPFWFIPMMVVFYVLSPALIYIDTKMPVIYWAIIPLFLYSICAGRDGPYGPLTTIIYYLPVYLFGMACSRFESNFIDFVKKKYLIISFVMLSAWIVYVFDISSSLSYMLIMKVSMALLIITWLKNNHNVFNAGFDFIADASFGIYFIHSYIISTIKLGFVKLSVWHNSVEILGGFQRGTLLGYVFYVSVVLALSIFWVLIFRMTFGKTSRIIIGA